MGDGIYSQLGLLVGRLRGYEREFELIQLIAKKEKKEESANEME